EQFTSATTVCGSTRGSTRIARPRCTRPSTTPMKRRERCWRIRAAANSRRWVATTGSSAKTRSRQATIRTHRETRSTEEAQMFEIRGLDEAMRSVKRMQDNVRRLEAQHNIKTSDLFAPDFMRRYTKVASFDALIDAG